MSANKESFDFKEKSAELLKRIRSAPGTNPELMRVSIEVALREAYTAGQANASGFRAPNPRPAAPGRAAASPAQAAQPSDGCEHEWEESFLDGRTIGKRCMHCEVLESTLKAQCAHYFVKSGNQEVCIACRSTRRAR